MKYIDEYRDGKSVKRLADEIAGIVTRPWVIMEICGGQTHAIAKFGIDSMLPDTLTLVHGPGCPVCVTPLEKLDRAMQIAALPDVVFCSFGDMLRVPGSRADLLSLKAEGADVRIVYSPLDALKIARNHPEKQVVFFAVGFETTAPANAMAVYQAHKQGLKNFSVLVSHVLVPPAMEAILSSTRNRVQGFLAAGHVCTIMGIEEYRPVSERYKVPVVVTGFEPLDILQGILMCVKQLERGESKVENQYARVVRDRGNESAQAIIRDVFKVTHRKWRGLGEIASSGFSLTDKYENFDAEKRFSIELAPVEEPEACVSGEILQGLKKPFDCAAFGKECTPEHPLGATMVSSEGACAAYYRYRYEQV